mmetsp:Transcript_52713/g.109980  ORF Transcript_52713/g.109980 Transcript_52713/m.109980 type:complete len:205 (-) Transcript_52713:2759-3373(-)
MHRTLPPSRRGSARRPHDHSQRRRGVSYGARRPRPPPNYSSRGGRINYITADSPSRRPTCDARSHTTRRLFCQRLCDSHRHSSHENHGRALLISTLHHGRRSARSTPRHHFWHRHHARHMQSYTRAGSMELHRRADGDGQIQVYNFDRLGASATQHHGTAADRRSTPGTNGGGFAETGAGLTRYGGATGDRTAAHFHAVRSKGE